MSISVKRGVPNATTNNLLRGCMTLREISKKLADFRMKKMMGRMKLLLQKNDY